MKQINWGIIGCGDVTEVKSGPAFNKVPNSKLVAVMRRDGAKAADYAKRHNVPKWYNDATKLINDPEVNAIYIATPPSSHEEYTLQAIAAGKPVYVEKPMALNAASAATMQRAASEKNIKLSVAHYRRQQPLFKKVKQLFDDNVIGDVRLVKLEYLSKPLSQADLSVSKTAWRVDAAISGGGLFHDLAPHQLDLMYYFFGEVEKVFGVTANHSGLYNAEDIVAGNILFKSGAVFSGVWCFTVAAENEKDVCEIVGSAGKISFGIFDQKGITLTMNDKTEVLSFDALQHVQQPMIEKVVQYFLGEEENPCSGKDGVEVMKMIDEFAKG